MPPGSRQAIPMTATGSDTCFHRSVNLVLRSAGVSSTTSHRIPVARNGTHSVPWLAQPAAPGSYTERMARSAKLNAPPGTAEGE